MDARGWKAKSRRRCPHPSSFIFSANTLNIMILSVENCLRSTIVMLTRASLPYLYSNLRRFHSKRRATPIRKWGGKTRSRAAADFYKLIVLLVRFSGKYVWKFVLGTSNKHFEENNIEIINFYKEGRIRKEKSEISKSNFRIENKLEKEKY